MNREQAKQHIKTQIESYLEKKGINTKKRFKCLNPGHEDKNPSMSLDRERNKAHCFSCDAHYDTLDIIAIDYGLIDKKEVFAKAYDVFNIEVSSSFKETPKAEETNQHGQDTQQQDYLAYFKEKHAHIGETSYPQSRGLTEKTIKRFMLGYDKAFKTQEGEKCTTWQALIIPTGKGSFIARNTKETIDKNNRIRKRGVSHIFNRKILTSTTKPIFVVEGEIDALSIIEAGGEAIALGSTSNCNKFLNLIKNEKPTTPLLISLDNDIDGKNATERLKLGLQELNIAHQVIDIAGTQKDANEALIADKEAFVAAVQAAENIEEEDPEKKECLNLRAANHIESFLKGIADSVNTPHISTGFSCLDELLDGGLYEGLYIVGAITSLGKTTFALQIADQIAQQSNDILIFSLEMARTELMAKSISRLTLLNSVKKGKYSQYAKTSRGITTCKRYENYSRDEIEIINKSINEYKNYASNIYIKEGMGDIGIKEIRETIKKLISFTGKKPVVIIDYLQILAPYDVRMTDKQNTDKSVMELKRISRDYKIPVLAISSFNRQNYKEAVAMEAFKESGAIEYSSDVLIGLQFKRSGTNGFDLDVAKNRNPREVELKILKNRNGGIGKPIEYDYYPLFNYYKEK